MIHTYCLPSAGASPDAAGLPFLCAARRRQHVAVWVVGKTSWLLRVSQCTVVESVGRMQMPRPIGIACQPSTPFMKRLGLACLSQLQDHGALREAGVAAFYGPGTRVPAAALDIIDMLLEEPQQRSHGTA